ncbi:hypothetical protein V9T40_001453 [Parthenolecanium corni]|uniref:Uncharacterized protein n=1 Tax=Parthenolecanium corni TaxID=536013 RepID=A0AAN9Y6K8_9HEMI
MRNGYWEKRRKIMGSQIKIRLSYLDNLCEEHREELLSSHPSGVPKTQRIAERVQKARNDFAELKKKKLLHPVAEWVE